jgi:hypothetical protein
MKKTRSRSDDDKPYPPDRIKKISRGSAKRKPARKKKSKRKAASSPKRK